MIADPIITSCDSLSELSTCDDTNADPVIENWNIKKIKYNKSKKKLMDWKYILPEVHNSYLRSIRTPHLHFL